ncbi:MAG: Nif3-like dinuclear metal center hexameric protein [Prevotellaceae bacterium]|nr:Nif3-like dinuclear metal center hexameric protein [Prevotellaceae bacterium]
MTTVQTICEHIEKFAPLALQESYDNAGLLVGDARMEVSNVLVCIDVTEKIIDEAIENDCNLIVSHHPLIFGGIKRLTGQNDVQRCIIKAIRYNIAVYASHTNLDNVSEGVNGRIADKIGLKNRRILSPVQKSLLKLTTYLPDAHLESVRNALFEAGAGTIGNYDACSFSAKGIGTFRANENAHPFVGSINKLHEEAERKLEVILPKYLKKTVLNTLLDKHPYEEPAYDFIPLENEWMQAGSGIVGELENEEDEIVFLKKIKATFKAGAIRHSALSGKKIKKVALCGGAGSHFLSDAIAQKADIFISGDFKYHEFFAAENKILIADIGHYESEQYTKELLGEIITKKIPTFAVRISEINTNPIIYL